MFAIKIPPPAMDVHCAMGYLQRPSPCPCMHTSCQLAALYINTLKLGIYQLTRSILR